MIDRNIHTLHETAHAVYTISVPETPNQYFEVEYCNRQCNKLTTWKLVNGEWITKQKMGKRNQRYTMPKVVADKARVYTN